MLGHGSGSFSKGAGFLPGPLLKAQPQVGPTPRDKSDCHFRGKRLLDMIGNLVLSG